MRAFGMLAIATTFLLTPVLAGADPVQPAASATASSTSATGNTVAGTPATAERVVVQGDVVGDNLDQTVCKYSAPTTGSRLGGGRECRTEREWNDRQKKSQDVLHSVQNIGGQEPLKSFGGK
jgi:hypothetical protein